MTTLSSINMHSVFVLDQDEALDFYVGKLGLEVESDADLGFMRWLTVKVPGDEGREIMLQVPGQTFHDPETTQKIRELLTQGALGTAVFFNTEDAVGSHQQLVDKGVDVAEAPQQQPYGIDFGIRDPFGNHIRICQPTPMREITEEDLQRWAPEEG